MRDRIADASRRGRLPAGHRDRGRRAAGRPAGGRGGSSPSSLPRSSTGRRRPVRARHPAGGPAARAGHPAEQRDAEATVTRGGPDPGRRVELRRDRHRGRRGRPADPRQRGGQPGRDARGDRRDRAGGRGAGPPALDRARARRGVGRGRRRLGRHRGRGGDRGSGARRLAARRHQLRQDARLRPRQAAGSGQPPRGAPLRGVARRTRAEMCRSRSSRWLR